MAKQGSKQSVASSLQRVLMSASVLGVQATVLSAPVLLGATPANALWLGDFRNDYEYCAGQLLETDLTPEAIAVACAEALHPDEVANCVVDITQGTVLTSETTLAGCKRVRRPEDLASCVLDIDSTADVVDGVAAAALDHCRRSLLPLEFADCVVGLRTELLGLASFPAMAVCIDADDRAIEYLPDFVFGVPLTEGLVPESAIEDDFITDPSIQLTPFGAE